MAPVAPKEEAKKELFSETTPRFSIVGKISEDRLKFFVDITLPEIVPGQRREAVTKGHIMDVLKQFIRADLINEPVLDDIVQKLPTEHKILDRRLAKGTPPEPGIDGKLLLLVKKFTGEGSVQSDEKGRTEFHELHLFDNILKGQPVARVYEPKLGKPGKTALGEPIPAPIGKAAKVVFDKTILAQGVVQGESYHVLVADTDGYLVEQGGKLHIAEELSISHDIDFKYGNIDFVGKVLIKGDVLPGFNITAKKGIEISGSVRGGSLTAVDGDIIVKGFVFGGEKSRVISGKSFTADVVQEVNAEIRGEITVIKESRDCVLRSQSLVRMPRAHCLGGKIYTVCGGEFKELGNAAELRTEVELCSDIEATREYSDLQLQIANHIQALEMLKLHLGPLAGKTIRLELIKSEHREKIQKLVTKLKQVEASHAKLLLKRDEMLAQGQRGAVARVNVLGILHRGAVIRSGEELFELKESKKGPFSIDYLVEEKKFTVGELKGLECSYGEQKTTKSK